MCVITPPLLFTFAFRIEVSVKSDSKGNTGENPGQSRCCISQVMILNE